MASLSHVLISLLIFGISLSIHAMVGPFFAAALAGSAYFLGRELAQSMRPSDPLKIKWSWSNSRGFLYPLGVLIVVATALTIFF
jgi:hypothetical protein